MLIVMVITRNWEDELFWALTDKQYLTWMRPLHNNISGYYIINAIILRV